MSPRLFLLLIALGIGPLLHAQPPAENRVDAQGRKQGAWSKTWPDGTVRYTGQFKDDKPTGIFYHYDEEGTMVTQQTYADGGAISRAIHFHPEGEIMAKGKYVGQQKDSTWNYYDEAGHLQSVERYVGGQLHGERTVYYDNGGVAETTIYDHDQKHGPWRQYFEGGVVKASAEYVHGVPEGMMIWNYPSGKPELKGRMVNGERDGAWTYYNEDGSEQIILSYTNGEMLESKKMNGVFKDYYADDQLKEEVTWKDGAMNGPFTEYYNNGTWETREVPANASTGEEADTEQVLTGQSKKRTGTYKNGQLDGEVKTYTESGAVVKTETYAEGKLISNGP